MTFWFRVWEEHPLKIVHSAIVNLPWINVHCVQVLPSIFNTHQMRFGASVPETRYGDQVWIALTREVPWRLNASFDGFFNFTATYNERSDIVYNYGRTRRLTNFHTSTKQLVYIKGKEKLIAWFVSHCGAPSKRDDFVRDLKTYIPVDVYGTCGNLTCELKLKVACLNMLQREYKFYLSFENTICEDYVTEKVWDILSHNIVPVVLGGANYTNVLPPNSYIDVTNFTSTKALANYLKLVAGNDILYNSYFDWKRSYYIDRGSKAMTCSICKMMNTRRGYPSILKSYNKFLNGKDHCQQPKTFYSSFLNPKPSWLRKL